MIRSFIDLGLTATKNSRVAVNCLFVGLVLFWSQTFPIRVASKILVGFRLVIDKVNRSVDFQLSWQPRLLPRNLTVPHSLKLQGDRMFRIDG